jgi:hypothetical protein
MQPHEQRVQDVISVVCVAQGAVEVPSQLHPLTRCCWVREGTDLGRRRRGRGGGMVGVSERERMGGSKGGEEG